MTNQTEQTLSYCMGIYNEWVREDLLEDRLEYCDEDIQLAHPELTELNISYLRDILEDVKKGLSIIDMDHDPKVLQEVIGEACHQGLDGWSDEEAACISAFLRDIGIACVEYNKEPK